MVIQTLGENLWLLTQTDMGSSPSPALALASHGDLARSLLDPQFIPL